MMRKPLPRLRRFAADARGVAAVEFALLAPILVLLYFGVAELTMGMMAERRAAHVASTTGDLVAQSSTITAAEVGDIFTVGNTILYPFPTAPLEMRLTSITADVNGVTTVAWSQGSGMTALTKGAPVTVSSNVISANQSVIMAESQYTYTSATNYVLPHPIVFTEKYYLRPRLSDQVTCADC